ncbi:MAG: hypothetical protein AABO58_20775 [Acidobacteriota bacterium]
MAAALVSIVSMAVLGLPVALAVDRRARGPLLIGTAFLYGSGLVFVVLLVLSILHIRWTLLSVTVAGLLGCSVAWFAGRTRVSTQHSALSTRHSSPHVLDLITLLTLAGYALYATLAPLWEWDFWAIWGLKARVFLEQGGIDWRFLGSQWNVFAHPDYPLLVPLNYDFIALLGGGWSDRWLGVLLVAWAAAALLIVRGLAAQELPPFVASLVTLATASAAVSAYVGLAEGPLIAFGAAGVLFIRRAILFDDPSAWRHGALLLGLAANVKNEGLALLVAVGIAVLILKPRMVLRLWPAAALAAPWLILRATHVLPTDIVAGSVFSRIIGRLPYVVPMGRFLFARLHEPWFWLAIVAGIVIAPAARRRREAFVLIATAVQLAFFITSYLATPHDPRWHIATSWPRLTVQLALPITFATIMMLAVSFPGVEESADAEARSEQQ